MEGTFDVRRYLEVVVSACWIVLTIVTIQTASRWSAAHASSEARVHRELDVADEGTAESGEMIKRAIEAAQGGPALTPDDLREIKRAGDRNSAELKAANQAMIEALAYEKVERHQFWWECAAWAALTLLGGVLAAGRRSANAKQPT